MNTPTKAAAPLPAAPPPTATVLRNRSTERARECRRRKKDGLRLIPVEIFEQEIDDLVQLGRLSAAERTDRISVSHALYPVIEAGFAAIKEARNASAGRNAVTDEQVVRLVEIAKCDEVR